MLVGKFTYFKILFTWSIDIILSWQKFFVQSRRLQDQLEGQRWMVNDSHGLFIMKTSSFIDLQK